MFSYYLSVIKNVFKTTKSLRICIYILITVLYWYLWRFSSFFKKIYLKKASQFQDCIVKTKHWEYMCSNFHDFLMVDDNYEPEMNNAIKKVNKTKGDYLINIGCNVWRWAIACAKMYGYNVIAFEPAPETFRRLKINVLLSKLEDKIQIMNVWLWNNNWTMKFDYIPQRNWWSKIIQDDTILEWNTIEVPVKRFDDLNIDDEKIEKTRLIIMDVEWFEYQALKWMEKSLKKFHDISIMVEIWKDHKDKENTINFMKWLWYTAKEIDEGDWVFKK